MEGSYCGETCTYSEVTLSLSNRGGGKSPQNPRGTCLQACVSQGSGTKECPSPAGPGLLPFPFPPAEAGRGPHPEQPHRPLGGRHGRRAALIHLPKAIINTNKLRVWGGGGVGCFFLLLGLQAAAVSLPHEAFG